MIKQFSIGFWLLLAIFGGELQASYTISTYAGTGVNDHTSGDGGSAIQATFNYLTCIYHDESTSNLYISEYFGYNNGSIRKVNSSGIISQGQRI